MVPLCDAGLDIPCRPSGGSYTYDIIIYNVMCTCSLPVNQSTIHDHCTRVVATRITEFTTSDSTTVSA